MGSLQPKGRLYASLIALGAVLGFLASHFLQPLVGKYLEMRPPIWLYDGFDNAVLWGWQVVIAILQWPYWAHLAIGAVLFCGGVWFDWFARRHDKKARANMRGLGMKMESKAEVIERFTNRSVENWPKNVEHIRPELIALLINIKKQGMWQPGFSVFEHSAGERFLPKYLKNVGTLLREDHEREARQVARNSSDKWKEEIKKR